MPKRPPMPKPMTPDMTDFPRHDSIAACTCTGSRQLSGSAPAAASEGRTARTLGSCGPPACGEPPPAGSGKLMLLAAAAAAAESSSSSFSSSFFVARRTWAKDYGPAVFILLGVRLCCGEAWRKCAFLPPFIASAASGPSDGRVSSPEARQDAGLATLPLASNVPPQASHPSRLQHPSAEFLHAKSYDITLPPFPPPTAPCPGCATKSATHLVVAYVLFHVMIPFNRGDSTPSVHQTLLGPAEKGMPTFLSTM